MLTASGVDEALPVLVEAAHGYGIGGIDDAADGIDGARPADAIMTARQTMAEAAAETAVSSA